MHAGITVLSIVCSFFLVRWEKWREFYPTMLFVALGNMLYQFIVQDYHLWEYRSDLKFMDYTVTELAYTFIVFPLTVAMFLTRFPNTFWKSVIYIAKWAAIYSVMEAIGYWAGKIHYHHGWNYWWSVFFDVTMFPMIRLHYRYPFWALLASVPISLFYVWMFHIPISHKLVG